MRSKSSDYYQKNAQSIIQDDNRFVYKNECTGKDIYTSKHKRTFSGKAKSNIFDQEFTSKEIFKVPFTKSFMRQKLFYITNLPQQTTVKDSLTSKNILNVEKNESLNNSQNRIKKIYGRGQIYNLNTSYDEDQKRRFNEILNNLKSEKVTAKSFRLRNMNIQETIFSTKQKETIQDLNHERNNIKNLDEWHYDRIENPQFFTSTKKKKKKLKENNETEEKLKRQFESHEKLKLTITGPRKFRNRKPGCLDDINFMHWNPDKPLKNII